MKTTAIPTLCALLLLLSANTATEAGGAKTWQQHAYFDFAKGESEGVSIAAAGALALAPALETLTELETERIWSLAHAPNGGLYAGTGDSGRLYAIDAEGQARLLFDSPELVLHALLVGPDGAIYAGSAPDGLIYKINAKGQSETFAHTGSHYVWDLAFVDGQLRAATGEPGQVLKIAKDGSHEVLFDPDDRHVMSLLTHDETLRSECWVFDARDLGPGPLAKVSLPQRVPSGFHADAGPGDTQFVRINVLLTPAGMVPFQNCSLILEG